MAGTFDLLNSAAHTLLTYKWMASKTKLVFLHYCTILDNHDYSKRYFRSNI
jgi:hypothetical protein